jgi:hypothetical protein
VVREGLFCRSSDEVRAVGLETLLIFSLLFLPSSPCVHPKRDVRIGARLFKTWTGKALVKL